MGAETGIAWTDHTFNPWWGCQRVSPGCTNCYAEAWDKFRGGPEKHWGPTAARRFFGSSHWSEPLKWNRAAERERRRARVFCASMADVFEDRRDLDEERERLWKTIHLTPHLDWQLLAKRPENMVRLAPPTWAERWPSNVWAGTTVEDQPRAEQRLPELVKVPAAVRFISAEPLLGAVDLLPWLGNVVGVEGRAGRPGIDRFTVTSGIDWVIAGGESGPGARPMELAWARSIVAQCRAARVPVFVKQLGAAASDPENGIAGAALEVPADAAALVSIRLKNRKGGDPLEWPTDLRIREFPGSTP